MSSENISAGFVQDAIVDRFNKRLTDYDSQIQKLEKNQVAVSLKIEGKRWGDIHFPHCEMARGASISERIEGISRDFSRKFFMEDLAKYALRAIPHDKFQLYFYFTHQDVFYGNMIHFD